MTLTPDWRTRIFGAGTAVVAVWLSFDLAQGNFFWVAVLSGLLALVLLARLQPLPLATLLVGIAVSGYVVGNRGFAQISLGQQLPILPAEAVLAFGGTLLLIQSAWRHELPLRRDALNFILLAWIALGTLRIGFDLRRFGLVALRDFALVYYAGFFYLGQEIARNPVGRRFMVRVLTWSCAALLPVYFLFDQLPGFFLGTFTWRGNPLIYFKGDLVGTFLAVGSVLFFVGYEQGGRRWKVAISLVLGGTVLAMNNRASMLALVVATAWLAVRGRWRFAAVQAAGGIAAILAILAGAAILRISWEKTPVFGLYERVVSIADPMGEGHYRGSETANKGDNNLFRAVWWRAVIADTVEENPSLGLGFGRDLADRFIREYYPESGEEFSTRSPHNVLISIFARMGVVGLALFLAILAVIAVYTWRAVGLGPREASLWCCVWAIIVSACLGVVLEGPMGAVVFWTLLGVANGTRTADEAGNLAAAPAPALPTSAASVARERTAS